MGKYRIYIDETGNSDLGSSDNHNHRFLSLTWIIIDLDYVENFLYPDMEKFKKQYFFSHPDEPIIFHRKEMVQKRPPFHVLKDPETEIRFNSELLHKLNLWDYKVITVLIDKKEHKELYSVWRYDPYHYCLALLMERYYSFLKDNKQCGDVMVESRGAKEDMRLKKSFRRVCDEGTDFITSQSFARFLTSKELKVKTKLNNISGLQLADIIAHPSRRDILLAFSLVSKNQETFGDKIIEVVRSKYYSHNCKIIGYGIKKLP